MAITYNGTKNSLPTAQIPAGYTRPTVTEFSDHEYERTLELSITKATVENATRSTTMTNIINDVAVGIDKQVEDLLAAEFLGTATVTAWGDMTALTNNLAAITGTDVWLSNTASAYKATVKVYIKSTP